MHRLLVLNKLRWRWRLPVKLAIFGLAVLVVCFPYPGRLVAHLRHWRDPNALIKPQSPAIQPLVEELRPRLSGALTSQDALKRVEQFVYEKIPYEWDWNTWGTADYLPTVTEAIEMGKEDCDGRAVVAASLLRNFGYEARLVTDFVHMWVKTDRGETMSPGKTGAVVATEGGLRVSSAALAELPRAFAVGVAVFPRLRELIIIAVLWLLLLRRYGGVACSLSGLVLFVGALFLLRFIGRHSGNTGAWLPCLGMAGLAVGFVPMLVVAGYHARRFRRATPGSDFVASCKRQDACM